MSLLPRAVRKARAVVHRLHRTIRPGRQRVLFVFHGGHGAWPGMGRELYRHHPVFRDSIDHAAVVVREVLGWDASAAFRGVEEVPPTLALTRRNQLVHLGLIEIGLVDLWRAEGIVPDGVLSLSLGEMVAPYASGAFTREHSARAVTVVAEALSRTVTPDRLFLVNADQATAERLCRTAPVPLYYIGDRGHSAFILGDEYDAPAIRAYLGRAITREHRNQWRYHSLRLDIDRDWMRQELRTLEFGRPRCPLYSAANGDLYAGPFNADFFAWMLRQPVRFGDAATTALAHGYDTVITIGAEPVARDAITAAMPRGARVEFIDSIVPHAELLSWKRARAAARGLRARKLAIAPQPLDPFEVYEQYRRNGSVHHLAGEDVWLVLGFDDVQRVLSDPARFSSATQFLAEVDPALLGSDPPTHTAVRRIVSRHFSADAVARWSRVGAESAERFLRPLAEGRDLDAVREFAHPIAQTIGAAILGLEASDLAELDEASLRAEGNARDVFTALHGPLIERAHRATLYHELLRDAEGALDDAAARSLIRVLWVASTEELRRTIPAAVLALLENADVRSRVTASPELLPKFVDEVLRLHPPEHAIERITTMEVELGGERIPAGARVRLMLAAANRDPLRFPDPRSLRLDRSGTAHLAFGAGPHRCIGAALARSTMAEVVGTLLRAAPGFRAVQPLTTIRYARGAPMRQIAQLVIGG